MDGRGGDYQTEPWYWAGEEDEFRFSVFNVKGLDGGLESDTTNRRA